MATGHCDFHNKYQAGCPYCQEKSRRYQSQKKRQRNYIPKPRAPNKTAHGTQEMWDRMTEIGKRWEKEGLI